MDNSPARKKRKQDTSNHNEFVHTNKTIEHEIQEVGASLHGGKAMGVVSSEAPEALKRAKPKWAKISTKVIQLALWSTFKFTDPCVFFPGGL